jgi:ferredoxin
VSTVGGCIGALSPLAVNATVSPETVVFESRGTVLVLGDDASAGDVAQALARHHRVAVFAPGVDVREFGPRVTAVGRQVTAVRGHLGAFQGEIRTDSGIADIGAASPNPGRFFDLVLDLGRKPLWSSEVAPFGYFAPGGDEAARVTAIESLRTLVGRFAKPRYFGYQAALCAHSASGLKGCTRCMDVCSAQAITSAGATIRVDPYLCQGCATCTLACPTGALTFKFPTRESLEERLHAALRSGGPAPTLIVHSDPFDAETREALGRHGALELPVDPLPAFGEELWLRAFALGAGALVLLDGETLPAKSRAAIKSRVAQVQAMLPAMGMPQNQLDCLTSAQLPAWLDARHGSDIQPEVATPGPATMPDMTGKTKRLAWLDAIASLGGAGTAQAPVELPAGAPYGDVRVNGQKCTLCFACTHLCPTGALGADHSTTQRLMFRESACVQCGLCVQGCPEKAMSLRARFAPQAMAARTITVLHQDEQFACKSCGEHFISRRLLASSLERLKNHPVLAKGGREALMTCPACRQREMLNLQ